MLSKKMSIYLLASVFGAFSSVSLADTEELILQKLLEKGVISDSEYQEALELKQIDEELTAKKAKKKAAKKKKGQASVKLGPGLKIKQGDSEVKVIGRLHYDFRSFDDDFVTSPDRDSGSSADGFETRRARLGVQGKMHKDFKYKIQLDASKDKKTKIDEAYFNWKYTNPLSIRLGKFKQPVSLEEQTSSNDIDLMERSYVNQLVDAKKLGFMLHGEAFNAKYYFSTYQQGSTMDSDSEGMMYAFRTHMNPVNGLHFGVSSQWGSYEIRPKMTSQTIGLGTDGSGFAGNDENDSATDSYTNHRGTVVAFRDENRGLKNVYRAQIGGTTYGTQASNTGTGDLDELYCNHTSATVSDLYGGCGVPNSMDEIAATIEKELWLMELAYHKGPVKFQTEWAHSVYDARHPAHDTLVGGGVDAKYYQLTYNITGESWAKAYNKGGKYKGIKPGQNWSKGSGGGAWQVAFRHSTYDAEDVKINDGTSSHWGSRLQGSNEAKTLTYGLNWILNPNVKFMFNYADTDYEFPVERLNGDDKIQGDRTTSDSQVMSARLKMSF